MPVPLTEFVPAYAGMLTPLRSALGAFLTAQDVDAAKVAEGGAQLVESLLATAEENMGLDWKQREPLQARLKVACKRVLVQFGSTPAKADEVAERLVAWLRVQAPEPALHVPVAAVAQ